MEELGCSSLHSILVVTTLLPCDAIALGLENAPSVCNVVVLDELSLGAVYGLQGNSLFLRGADE
jgi:hypothetical protein